MIAPSTLSSPLLSQIPAYQSGKKGWPWTEEVDPSVYDKDIEWPRISIVTPSYNQGNYIEQTIRSVLLQNYPNLEYIIIDGGSSDQTLRIIEGYERWITYWISKEDRGQTHAINKGIEKSTGDIFNWLNSDDSYEPLALMRIAESFVHHTPDVASAGERHFGENTDSIYRSGSTLRPTLEETVFVGHIDQPSTFWRMQVLRNLGGMNEDLDYLMDAELWMRYLLEFGKDKILKLDCIVAAFRLHDDSKTLRRQEAFTNERWSLRYSLLKHLNNSETLHEICGPLVKEPIPIELNIKQNLNRKLLFSIFAEELFKQYYYLSNYGLSRKAFVFLARSSMKALILNFTYFIKLFLIPPFFMKYIRSIKNG